MPFAPLGTPSLICTTFAIRAFRALGRAGGVSFVEKRLLRERDREHWITYIAGSDTHVHKVNMIGVALLGCRDRMECSVRGQRLDGSWWYGEAENQRWIDKFHTGYNLVALREYEGATGDTSFEGVARRGFD